MPALQQESHTLQPCSTPPHDAVPFSSPQLFGATHAQPAWQPCSDCVPAASAAHRPFSASHEYLTVHMAMQPAAESAPPASATHCPVRPLQRYPLCGVGAGGAGGVGGVGAGGGAGGVGAGHVTPVHTGDVLLSSKVQVSVPFTDPPVATPMALAHGLVPPQAALGFVCAFCAKRHVSNSRWPAVPTLIAPTY